MTCYVALLRGINVGGKNIVPMPELKLAFERQGFHRVITYINSGNVIFESDLEESAVKMACDVLMAENFSLDIPVFVLSAPDLAEALAHAPEWWNKEPDTRDDAFFVIPPMTAAEICAHVGAVKEEYEKVAYHGSVIFWSAPMATFSRTRWSKITKDKAMYRAITVRGAKTALKLQELTAEKEGAHGKKNL